MTASTAPSSAVAPGSASAQIHTYHCLCSTLLIATPYNFKSLPRRAAPSLDNAYILPMPALVSRSAAQNNDEDEEEGLEEGAQSRGATQQDGANGPDALRDETNFEGQQFSPSLLSPSLRASRKPVMITREDGFEKRRVWKCQQCGLSVAYEIERENGSTEVSGLGSGGVGGKIMYFPEGGLIETPELALQAGVAVPENG